MLNTKKDMPYHNNDGATSYFTVSGNGWHQVDVTDHVTAWQAGTSRTDNDKHESHTIFQLNRGDYDHNPDANKA